MAARKLNVTSINRGNLRSFIFFLFLATLFWFLTKFSKEYAADVTTTVAFLNIPEGTIVQENAQQEVPLNLEASGFEFLFYKLKMPKIPVDLSTINPDENGNWRLNKSQIEALATKAFKHPVRAQLPESGISLALDALGKRKVPVKANLDFVLEDGFAVVDSLIIHPDSITFIGPKIQLQGISLAQTEFKELTAVNKDVEGQLSIQIPNGVKQLKATPEQVNYSLKVAEFIETELLIPISLVNVPDGANIKLFPSTIKVTYRINFDDYKKVSASDFKIICDFEQVAPNSNIVIPELVTQPEAASQVNLATSQVEFIYIQ